MIEQPTLTALGQTTQLRVTATLADGTTNDVTSRTKWTVYRTSNPQIATVGPDGLVTAVGRGIAFLTAVNEGASSVAQVNVSPGLLTIVQGRVVTTNGTPAIGALVTVVGFGLSRVTGLDGRFSIPDMPSGLGQISLRIRFVQDRITFFATVPNLTPVPGGITDAGIITVAPALARVYVANSGDDTVSVILPETVDVIATIPVGDNPVSVGVTPDGSRAYVINSAADTVSVIDTGSESVIATIPAWRSYRMATRPLARRGVGSAADSTESPVTIQPARSASSSKTFSSIIEALPWQSLLIRSAAWPIWPN